MEMQKLANIHEKIHFSKEISVQFSILSGSRLETTNSAHQDQSIHMGGLSFFLRKIWEDYLDKGSMSLTS
jgi:hypothetical protein